MDTLAGPCAWVRELPCVEGLLQRVAN